MAQMKNVTAAQNVQVALVKISQEAGKMQGEAVLELIESAQAHDLTRIDVSV